MAQTSFFLILLLVVVGYVAASHIQVNVNVNSHSSGHRSNGAQLNEVDGELDEATAGGAIQTHGHYLDYLNATSARIFYLLARPREFYPALKVEIPTGHPEGITGIITVRPFDTLFIAIACPFNYLYTPIPKAVPSPDEAKYPSVRLYRDKFLRLPTKATPTEVKGRYSFSVLASKVKNVPTYFFYQCNLAQHKGSMLRTKIVHEPLTKGMIQILTTKT